jgi:hypothetical protein
MDSLLNHSPDGDVQNAITPGGETQRGKNRFDRDLWLRRGETAAKVACNLP